MNLVSQRAEYSLYNVVGEPLLLNVTTKKLCGYINDTLGIDCTLSALYRSIAVGSAVYGMTVLPKGKKVVLAHGFGESSEVYKYFQDVPVAKYGTMSEACKANGLSMRELKEHMLNVTNIGDNIFLPYKIDMMRARKEREEASGFTGIVCDTIGNTLFRYRSRLDLELKLGCDVSRVTKINLLREEIPLLNSGVVVISDTKKFN